MITSSVVTVASPASTADIQEHVVRMIDDLLTSLPSPESLSAEDRRSVIARYTAVLEGNFIYWMTGAYLAVKSDAARAKIIENLREEVRDAHPLMMRRFAVAARAVPTEADTLAVQQNLTRVRLFIGRLSPVATVVSMAFFEGFIQRFMPFLAELARLQGSSEMQYTDVHGVCDIEHTEELYRALEAEMVLTDDAAGNVLQGAEILRALVADIVYGPRLADRFDPKAAISVN